MQTRMLVFEHSKVGTKATPDSCNATPAIGPDFLLQKKSVFLIVAVLQEKVLF